MSGKKPGPDGPSKYTPEFIKGLAAKLWKYAEESVFPNFARFAFIEKIDKRLGSELCEKSDEFCEAFKNMMAKQEAVLLEGSLAGKLNPASAIFQLKNNHGYKDRIDHSLPGNIGGETKIIIIHPQDKATETNQRSLATDGSQVRINV